MDCARFGEMQQLLCNLTFGRAAQIYGESWHLRCKSIGMMVNGEDLKPCFPHGMAKTARP